MNFWLCSQNPLPPPLNKISSTQTDSKILLVSLSKHSQKNQHLQTGSPLVKEIVSSPEGSPVRDSGTSSTEQATPAVGAGKAPAESSSSPTPKTPGSPPQGWVLNGRPLPNRSPNKALLRGNHWLSPWPRKRNLLHQLLLNWHNFFNGGWSKEKFVKVAYYRVWQCSWISLRLKVG